MALAPGARLGPYEILGPLGAGGMGEVYRARDTRIGRDVAIKVLPAGVAGDETRLRRFEVEARAAGALSHPNLLVLFDVGTEAGAPYVVTELLEGETLRERLRGGALPVRKACDIAAQAARGLGAAHAKGIVHRDLKPENLFVTPDGRVKILDFGLAKLTRPEEAGSGIGAARTVPTLSEAGTVLGTVGYMAPEQVEGKPVGPPADVFALGAVTYEMLAGERAFLGESVVDTMHAILRQEPRDLPANAGIPPALDRIVRRCLEKQPEARFRSADDLAFALDTLSGSGSSLNLQSAARVPARRSWLKALGLAAAAVAMVAAGFAGARWLQPVATAPKITQLTFRRQGLWQARFAPDGQTIIYGAVYQDRDVELFAARVGSQESRALGIRRADVFDISRTGELAIKLGTAPFGPGTLARMPMEGGSPRELATDVASASWAPDGTDLAIIRIDGGRRRLEFPIGTRLLEEPGAGGILRFAPTARLIALQWLEAGKPILLLVDPSRPPAERVRPLVAAAVLGHCWSPDSSEVRYAVGDARVSAIRSVSVAGRDRELMSLPGQFIMQDCRSDGALLVERATESLEIAGILPGESDERDLSWLDTSTAHDLSPDGSVVLFSESGTAGTGTSTFIRKIDGSPAVRLGVGTPRALSPDGRWALARQFAPDGAVEHVLLPTGPGQSRTLPVGNLTVRPASPALWMPDGKRVVFSAISPGRPRCYAQSIDGGDPVPLTPEGAGGCRATSPDGRHVLVAGNRVVDLDTSAVRPIPGLAASDEALRWSGDGRSLFVIERAGAANVRVHRLDLASGRRELVRALHLAGPIGAGGLTNVLVSADGKTIVYTSQRYFSDLLLIEGLR